MPRPCLATCCRTALRQQRATVAVLALFAGGLALLATHFISTTPLTEALSPQLPSLHQPAALPPAATDSARRGETASEDDIEDNSTPGQDNPGAPDSEATWLAWLSDTMRTSPSETLLHLAALPDADLRQCWLAEAMKIWAATDGRNALEWVLLQTGEARGVLLEAAAHGLACDPALALALGRELLARDAEAGTRFGGAVLPNLINAGQYAPAWQFAASTGDEIGKVWRDAALRAWAAAQPAAALQALGTVQDPIQHRLAFAAVMKGWVASAPAGVADYLLTLPPGADRQEALDLVLQHWSLVDPTALGEWLNAALISGQTLTDREFDQLAEALATRTDAAQRPPEVARAWAGMIADPDARARSLAKIDRQEHPAPPFEPAEE